MSGTTQQRAAEKTRGEQTGKQATYLVIDGNEVVFRSPHFGEAWGFRNGWGADGALIAKVIAQPGQQTPDDEGNDPDREP